MDGYALPLILVVIVLVIALVTNKDRLERFSVAERDGRLCGPFFNNRDAALLPASVAFVIQGYNYEEPPLIVRDGTPVTPLQYAWDSDNMTFYLVIAAPKGLDGHQWMVQTSDYVKPTVNEGRLGTPLRVELKRRRHRYNWWDLSPR